MHACNGTLDANAFAKPRVDFSLIPNSSLSYDLPNDLWQLFTVDTRLEPNLGVARQGLGLSDSWRWFRRRSEVSAELIGKGKAYVPLANGGGFAPFYRELDLVIFWENDGHAIKDAEAALYRSWSRTVKNVSFYFRKGLSFPKRTDYLNAHVLPPECIFSQEGLGFFCEGDDTERWWALALLNSRLYSFLINAYCGQHKSVGYVKQLPYRTVRKNLQAIEAAKAAWMLKRNWATRVTTSILFVSPAILSFASCDCPVTPSPDVEQLSNVFDRSLTLTEILGRIEVANSLCCERLGMLQQEVDDAVCQGFSLSASTVELIIEQTARRERLTPLQGVWEDVEGSPCLWIHDLVAYSLMVVFGKWDLRIGLNPALALHLPGAFDPLPPEAPGALRAKSDFATEAKSTYQVRVDNDGILVDDENSLDDIVNRMREIFEVVWGDRAEKVEEEASKLLSVGELREYFRKSGKGSFWDNHLRQYTTGRRKAPLLWLLQSSKVNYALWLYYHRLDKDLLFKVLVNHVEPKIRLESSRLETLTSQKAAAADSGKVAKRLAKEVEWQEDFLTELRDFEDKLRRAANLHLEPDLNDGVVLNIAPLWELVPWKEAKNYWEELLKGEYEWSSIGKQLRQKGLVQ